MARKEQTAKKQMKAYTLQELQDKIEYEPSFIQLETENGEAIEGLFFNERISSESLNGEYHKYELRWIRKEDNCLYTLENHVRYGFAGTLLTEEPITENGEIGEIGIKNYCYIHWQDHAENYLSEKYPEVPIDYISEYAVMYWQNLGTDAWNDKEFVAGGWAEMR